MRKRLITRGTEDIAKSKVETWLDLEPLLADVEMTSEDPAHPIESALLTNSNGYGWRASEPGLQRIRLIFAKPQNILRMQLRFDESALARTQEYVLRWSQTTEQSCHEILRQQWNFSPDGSISELDDIQVKLVSLTVLELEILPDISGGHAIASLSQLRLA